MRVRSILAASLAATILSASGAFAAAPYEQALAVDIAAKDPLGIYGCGVGTRGSGLCTPNLTRWTLFVRVPLTAGVDASVVNSAVTMLDREVCERLAARIVTEHPTLFADCRAGR